VIAGAYKLIMTPFRPPHPTPTRPHLVRSDDVLAMVVHPKHGQVAKPLARQGGPQPPEQPRRAALGAQDVARDIPGAPVEGGLVGGCRGWCWCWLGWVCMRDWGCEVSRWEAGEGRLHGTTRHSNRRPTHKPKPRTESGLIPAAASRAAAWPLSPCACSRHLRSSVGVATSDTAAEAARDETSSSDRVRGPPVSVVEWVGSGGCGLNSGCGLGERGKGEGLTAAAASAAASAAGAAAAGAAAASAASATTNAADA